MSMPSMATSKSVQKIASDGLKDLLRNPARMRVAQGRVLLKIRLLKAALESATDPQQKHTLSTALQVFRKGVCAEMRRSAWAGLDEGYRQTLLMIDHECDLDAPLGG